MIWLTALGHLLGAVADLSPAALVASIAVVVLAMWLLFAAPWPLL